MLQMATLGPSRYGKQKVRVLRKHIDGDSQSVVEISADTLLEGTFERPYPGDNTQVAPTDTCKNTIITLTHDHPGPCIEEFGLKLGRPSPAERVHIELREKRRDRFAADFTALGLKNPSLAFLPQDRAHGQIEATGGR